MIIMVILVFFMVISINRRLFRYFGSYSGISVIPVILVNRRTAITVHVLKRFSTAAVQFVCPNTTKIGVAKVRKEASFRKRKVPFVKGRFWLRKEDFFITFQCPFEVN